MKDLSKNKIRNLDPLTFSNNRIIGKVNVMENDMKDCIRLSDTIYTVGYHINYTANSYVKRIQKTVCFARENMQFKNFYVKCLKSNHHVSLFLLDITVTL